MIDEDYEHVSIPNPETYPYDVYPYINITTYQQAIHLDADFPTRARVARYEHVYLRKKVKTWARSYWRACAIRWRDRYGNLRAYDFHSDYAYENLKPDYKRHFERYAKEIPPTSSRDLYAQMHGTTFGDRTMTIIYKRIIEKHRIYGWEDVTHEYL